MLFYINVILVFFADIFYKIDRLCKQIIDCSCHSSDAGTVKAKREP